MFDTKTAATNAMLIGSPLASWIPKMIDSGNAIDDRADHDAERTGSALGAELFVYM